MHYKSYFGSYLRMMGSKKPVIQLFQYCSANNAVISIKYSNESHIQA